MFAYHYLSNCDSRQLQHPVIFSSSHSFKPILYFHFEWWWNVVLLKEHTCYSKWSRWRGLMNYSIVDKYNETFTNWNREWDGKQLWCWWTGKIITFRFPWAKPGGGSDQRYKVTLKTCITLTAVLWLFVKEPQVSNEDYCRMRGVPVPSRKI